MERAIKAYKLYGLMDDIGPPIAWARAGFRGYPGNVPDNPNRAHCTGRCTVPYTSGPFTWVWEPNHAR